MVNANHASSNSAQVVCTPVICNNNCYNCPQVPGKVLCALTHLRNETQRDHKGKSQVIFSLQSRRILQCEWFDVELTESWLSESKKDSKEEVSCFYDGNRDQCASRSRFCLKKKTRALQAQLYFLQKQVVNFISFHIFSQGYVSSDEDLCISEQEILRFKANHSSVSQQRRKLREKLRQQFNNMTLKDGLNVGVVHWDVNITVWGKWREWGSVQMACRWIAFSIYF